MPRKPKEDPGGGDVTTMALGEEEPFLPPDDGMVTTLAVGEEEPLFPHPVEPCPIVCIREPCVLPIPDPPEMTTMAIGEEDGGEPWLL